MFKTAWIKNSVCWGSVCQMSGKVIFHSSVDSHLVRAPCYLNPAILQAYASSSSCSRCCLSLPWALSYWGAQELCRQVPLPFASTVPPLSLPHCGTSTSCLSRSLCLLLRLLESLYCSTSLVKENMNWYCDSEVIHEGSYRWLLVAPMGPYTPPQLPLLLSCLLPGAKRITETVHPMMIHFSCKYQLNVEDPDATLRLKLL